MLSIVTETLPGRKTVYKKFGWPMLEVELWPPSGPNSYVEALLSSNLRRWPYLEIGSLQGNQVKVKSSGGF